MLRAVVFRFAEIFGDVAVESFMHAELDGAAADAVDAERKVKKRAERRNEPDEGDPDGRGARVALVEQGMNGGERRGARKSKPAAKCGQNRESVSSQFMRGEFQLKFCRAQVR